MCLTFQMERMDEEIKTLREVGAGGFFQTMPLPEGMAVTSSDVIASLNEHLVQVLQVRYIYTITHLVSCSLII